MADVRSAKTSELLGYHSATVRRWIHRYNADSATGRADCPARGDSSVR